MCSFDFSYRYDDQYTLSMEFIDGSSQLKRQKEFKISVASFFDDNGVLCCDVFETKVRELKDDLSKEKKSN